MRICICGGGSLGHVCAGFLASQHDVEMNIYSGHPDRWQDTVTVTDPDGKVFAARLHKVSGNAEDVISDQDIILLCLPGYLIEKTLIASFFSGGSHSVSDQPDLHSYFSLTE